MSKILGHYIVIGSAICHGQLTFHGTHILVADVLDQVVGSMFWGGIVEEWCGTLTKEAIAEADRLAREALLTHGEELVSNRHRNFMIND